MRRLVLHDGDLCALNDRRNRAQRCSSFGFFNLAPASARAPFSDPDWITLFFGHIHRRGGMIYESTSRTGCVFSINSPDISLIFRINDRTAARWPSVAPRSTSTSAAVEAGEFRTRMNTIEAQRGDLSQRRGAASTSLAAYVASSKLSIVWMSENITSSNSASSLKNAHSSEIDVGSFIAAMSANAFSNRITKSSPPSRSICRSAAIAAGRFISRAA